MLDENQLRRLVRDATFPFAYGGYGAKPHPQTLALIALKCHQFPIDHDTVHQLSAAIHSRLLVLPTARRVEGPLRTISVEEAHEIMERFEQAYPVIKRWKDASANYTRDSGLTPWTRTP